MAPLTEFHQEVETAIKPWKSSSEKPPFTAGELIVTALVLGGPMGYWEVIQWMEDKFPYYARLKLKLRYDNHIWASCNIFELPIVSLDAWVSTTWHALIPGARSYLQPMLGVKRQGSFPFLLLLPELRNKIYDMVFRYPQIGLSPRFIFNGREPRGIPHFFTLAKNCSPFQLWKAPWCFQEERTHNVQQILSLLLVNRQIFQECFTYFYRINLFSCICLSSFPILLRTIPLYRRQNISQLAFQYGPRDAKVAIGALRYIAGIPNLRKLYIQIDEPCWLAEYLHKHTTHSVEQFNRLKIPDLSIRGLDEVVFNGDCPTIAAYLKPQMERKDRKILKRKEAEIVIRRPLARAAKSRKVSSH